MHHLAGHPNVTLLKGAYEDRHHVHLVSAPHFLCLTRSTVTNKYQVCVPGFRVPAGKLSKNLHRLLYVLIMYV